MPEEIFSIKKTYIEEMKAKDFTLNKKMISLNAKLILN